MELANLHDLMVKTKDSFDPKLFDSERTLPSAFKEEVPNFDGTELSYKDYTCVLVERTPGLNIVFPNQWFYIAAYMTDYYHMILAYKQKVFDVLKFENLEKAKTVLRDVINNEDLANNLFDSVNYHGEDRNWLIKFICDYSWWGGGKSIDRADFFVSPVLSLAHLVNASQGFVAELCKFLAEHPAALAILKQELATPTTAHKPVATVNYAILAPLNKSYDLEELSTILNEMYESSGYVGIHLFGLKYGPFLSDINLKELCRLSHVPESYTAEINKMRNLYSAIKEHKYGVCFYEDFNFDLKEKIDSAKNLTETNMSYLRAMRTKPFLLLAGISGTGKSRIVKEMAFDSCPDNSELRKDPTSPGNYCLVEVKPNWHDSTELIGYESKINGDEYVAPTFVKFLAKAMLYENTPFFVCLDEMNLAPVEQYFAEFLSVLESRKRVGDIITSEPLIKAEVFQKHESKLKPYLFDIKAETEGYDGTTTADTTAHYGKENVVYDLLKKEGLRIPANVVVIGTVNMDETTHQFSRKVIDRAMTIEMNLPDGDPFMDFYDSRELGYRKEPLDASLYLPTKVSASEALEELAENNAEKTGWLKSEIAKILTDLNAQLESTPFKVAYRVQNELLLYFYEVWRENKDADWNVILNDAVDQILMMKVLPRVEGDEDLLEKPLARLADFCATGNYRKAAQKVAEMKNRLDRAHFTSYWP